MSLMQFRVDTHKCSRIGEVGTDIHGCKASWFDDSLQGITGRQLALQIDQLAEAHLGHHRRLILCDSDQRGLIDKDKIYHELPECYDDLLAGVSFYNRARSTVLNTSRSANNACAWTDRLKGYDTLALPGVSERPGNRRRSVPGSYIAYETPHPPATRVWVGRRQRRPRLGGILLEQELHSGKRDMALLEESRQILRQSRWFPVQFCDEDSYEDREYDTAQTMQHPRIENTPLTTPGLPYVFDEGHFAKTATVNSRHKNVSTDGRKWEPYASLNIRDEIVPSNSADEHFGTEDYSLLFDQPTIFNTNDRSLDNKSYGNFNNRVVNASQNVVEEKNTFPIDMTEEQFFDINGTNIHSPVISKTGDRTIFSNSGCRFRPCGLELHNLRRSTQQLQLSGVRVNSLVGNSCQGDALGENVTGTTPPLDLNRREGTSPGGAIPQLALGETKAASLNSQGDALGRLEKRRQPFTRTTPRSAIQGHTGLEAWNTPSHHSGSEDVLGGGDCGAKHSTGDIKPDHDSQGTKYTKMCQKRHLLQPDRLARILCWLECVEPQALVRQKMHQERLQVVQPITQLGRSDLAGHTTGQYKRSGQTHR